MEAREEGVVVRGRRRGRDMLAGRGKGGGCWVDEAKQEDEMSSRKEGN